MRRLREKFNTSQPFSFATTASPFILKQTREEKLMDQIIWTITHSCEPIVYDILKSLVPSAAVVFGRIGRSKIKLAPKRKRAVYTALPDISSFLNSFPGRQPENKAALFIPLARRQLSSIELGWLLRKRTGPIGDRVSIFKIGRTLLKIEQFKIESESEADEYLDDLLKEEKHRNIDEILLRAKHISDPALSAHFIH